MRKFIIFTFLNLIISISFAQKLPSGTYIFKYCDYEYNKCLSTCRVVIIGNKIKLYEVDKSSMKKGSLLDNGFIKKNKSGKWVIEKYFKTKTEKILYDESAPEINFKRKEIWHL